MLRQTVFIPIILLLFMIHALDAFSVSESPSGISYKFELGKVLNNKKPISAIYFSPDGRFIASGSGDGNVKLWDIESGKQVKSPMRHPSPILCLSFSPLGNVLASGAENGTISLWDVNYRERIRTLKGHEGKVWSVRFSPDGSLLASGSADKAVKLWEMKSGKEIRTLRGHRDHIYSLAFSPDGKILASGSADGSIKIWDIGSGKDVSSIKEGEGGINSIGFDPDGKILAYVRSDGTVKLILMDSGKEIISFGSKAGGVNCLSFSSDGRLLAFPRNNKIAVYEVSSGVLVTELDAHRGAINSIAFSPDRRLLASAGNDGFIKLWKIQVTESLKITLKAEYEGWLRGVLPLSAEVVGTADLVRFQYSLDGIKWEDISIDKDSPYSTEWDTRGQLPGVSKDIQIRAVAEKSPPGIIAMDISDKTFSIDNSAPNTEHDYDGLWHRSDFVINLSASDSDGSGVLTTEYSLNYGPVKNTKKDGQPKIVSEGVNVLEYWSTDKLGNAEERKVLTDVKLDKTAPVFSDWSKKLNGAFCVSVRVTDEGGSGLEGKTPQFDYFIGTDSTYDGYEDMSEGSDGRWHFCLPEPAGGFQKYIGETIHYKVRCADVAGNIGESAEQQEILGSEKSPPTVKIDSLPKAWERGTILISASADDKDGVITDVEFEYSLDRVKWTRIGKSNNPPYTLEWDTSADIPKVAKSVRIRVTATDNDGLSARYESPAFGIDNCPPIITHDYDGSWHKTDFLINLTASDEEGSGISKIMYRLNDGQEKDALVDGQPKVYEQGENTLEYWSIDTAGNESDHKILTGIKLDRLPPSFESWNVQRDNKVLHVEVEISDPDSGIAGMPELDYHIGSNTQYSGYKKMQKVSETRWRYDIEVSDISGEMLFCKVNARDVAGNLGIKMWEYEIVGPEGASEVALASPVSIPPAQKGMAETAGSLDTGGPSMARKSNIMLYARPSDTIDVGRRVSIQGHIEPKVGEPVPLNLTLVAPSGTIYASQYFTNSDGTFEFDIPLTSEGEWTLMVNWEGDDEYSATLGSLKLYAVTKKSGSGAKAESGTFFKKKAIIIGVLASYVLIVSLYNK